MCALFEAYSDNGQQKTLEKSEFQWLLMGNVGGECVPISKSQLEDADRADTVDRMLQTYGPDEALTVSAEILRVMNRNDLASQLKPDLK